MTSYLLILFYVGFLDTIPQPSLEACLQAAHEAVGKPMKVTVWDNMGGSNPVPTVHTAFCVQGEAAK